MTKSGEPSRAYLQLPVEERRNNQDQKPYPERLPVSWRIQHVIAYESGAIMFLLGSMQYYTVNENYSLGGWLFTFGATGFLIADAMSWWRNRVGCCCYGEYRSAYEKAIGDFFEPEESLRGRWQRFENGLNYFCAFLGSIVLWIGCIMFVPATHDAVIGTWLFIFGCSAIVLFQTWKVWRVGRTNRDHIADKTFKLSNFRNQIPWLLTEFYAIIGAVCYITGSTYYLPRYDIADNITNLAASCFVAGSFCYILSGFAMTYNYFGAK